MAQLYWDKVIPDRLIMHENNGSTGASLVIDLFSDNIVSVYQDSDLPVVRDKFEAMDESVEFDLDDYLFLLRSQIQLLEEWKKNERSNKTTDGNVSTAL